nr:glycosyltransferase family 4 protein [Longibacter salinarum]
MNPGTARTDAVLREVEEWSPDAVHIHSHSVPASLVPLLKSRLSRQTVFIEKNIWGEPSSYESLLHASCQLSSWCCWAYEQRSLNRKSRASSKPVLVTVPNAVRGDRFFPTSSKLRTDWRQSHGIPDDAVLLGRVGQSYAGKSHSSLLPLVRRLRACGVNAWLVSVAPSEKFRSAVGMLDPKTRPYIRILDRIDDPTELRRAYGAFDIFMHITRQGETFGNVLAESQACGVPVVTLSTPSRDNSQCEVVRNGQTGYVVAKWSKLFDAVYDLATDQRRREAMGAEGRRYVLSHFNDEVVIERLLSLIDTLHGLLQSPSSRPDEIRETLVERGLLSDISHETAMAERLRDCFGGLPLSWSLWSRFDRSRGIPFRVARRIDHMRRNVAEETFFAVDPDRAKDPMTSLIGQLTHLRLHT